MPIPSVKSQSRSRVLDSELLPFLNPKGIVAVGISTSPEKLGYGLARNLVASGYSGAIHFVTQRPGELFGQSTYRDIQSVPDPVDLAVLIVPAPAIPDALQACGQRGIRAAILVSAGFREAGVEGADLEATCLQIARSNRIRLLGPNCIGTIDTHLPLDTTFLQPPMPAQGGIGFISQSGAFCAAIIDWSRRQGFGFSQVVSLGNQADVTESDMLPLVATDEHTRVLALYLEAVADGSRFVQAARRTAEQKPIVALKVGRSHAGQMAATSHTGALAGSDVAYEAALMKAGVFRAESTEQMFDWARALELAPLPSGPRVAVITDAGGPGVIAADALAQCGLTLADLAPATRAALSALLPPAASVTNPVDMLASASPGQYAESLRLSLRDPGVDSALVILPPPPMHSAQSVAEALIPVIRSSGKPVVIALLGSAGVAAAFDTFNEHGVPTYPFPERAASALGILSRRARLIRHGSTEPRRPFQAPRAAPGQSVEAMLEDYGIPVLAQRLAASPEEAVALADQLGFPVALKIASPDITHKSDVSGVLTDVKTPSDVSSGFARITQAASQARPEAHILGISVQKQAGLGQDVIVGVVRDPTFGPMLMFGSGGTEAEGLKDVAFALAPLDSFEAEDLMRRTWAGRRLEGFRNLPPSDKAALADVLVRLSWFACDHPEFAEIEINPLRVFVHGVSAIDIRTRAIRSQSA